MKMSLSVREIYFYENTNRCNTSWVLTIDLICETHSFYRRRTDDRSVSIREWRTVGTPTNDWVLSCHFPIVTSFVRSIFLHPVSRAGSTREQSESSDERYLCVQPRSEFDRGYIHCIARRSCLRRTRLYLDLWCMWMRVRDAANRV